MEIMTWEAQTNYLKEVVSKVISDSTERDVRKLAMYPFHDVLARKEKLQEPKCARGNSWGSVVKVAVQKGLLGTRQLLIAQEFVQNSGFFFTKYVICFSTIFGQQTTLSQGSPRSSKNTDIYTTVHNSSKIIVIK